MKCVAKFLKLQNFIIRSAYGNDGFIYTKILDMIQELLQNHLVILPIGDVAYKDEV